MSSPFPASEEPRVAKIIRLIGEIFSDLAISRGRCIELLEEISADVDAKIDAMREDDESDVDDAGGE